MVLPEYLGLSVQAAKLKPIELERSLARLPD
jgi:hypothetical protein